MAVLNARGLSEWCDSTAVSDFRSPGHLTNGVPVSGAGDPMVMMMATEMAVRGTNYSNSKRYEMKWSFD